MFSLRKVQFVRSEESWRKLQTADANNIKGMLQKNAVTEGVLPFTTITGSGTSRKELRGAHHFCKGGFTKRGFHVTPPGYEPAAWYR